MAERLFLEILKTALRAGQMPHDTKISCEDMDKIFMTNIACGFITQSIIQHIK